MDHPRSFEQIFLCPFFSPGPQLQKCCSIFIGKKFGKKYDMLNCYSRSVFVVLKNRAEFSSFALHNTCLLTHLTVSINSYQILINWIRPRRGRQPLGRVIWQRQTVRETGRRGRVGEGPRGWGRLYRRQPNQLSQAHPSPAAMLLLRYVAVYVCRVPVT